MDVARGLDKMHSRHIIHLDLKSPNILLTAGGTAKIAVSLWLSAASLQKDRYDTCIQGNPIASAAMKGHGMGLWERFTSPNDPVHCKSEVSETQESARQI